jgi:hypothetical protein
MRVLRLMANEGYALNGHLLTKATTNEDGERDLHTVGVNAATRNILSGQRLIVSHRMTDQFVLSPEGRFVASWDDATWQAMAAQWTTQNAPVRVENADVTAAAAAPKSVPAKAATPAPAPKAQPAQPAQPASEPLTVTQRRQLAKGERVRVDAPDFQGEATVESVNSLAIVTVLTDSGHTLRFGSKASIFKAAAKPATPAPKSQPAQPAQPAAKPAQPAQDAKPVKSAPAKTEPQAAPAAQTGKRTGPPRCANCNKYHKATATVCPHCGAVIEQGAAQAAPATAKAQPAAAPQPVAKAAKTKAAPKVTATVEPPVAAVQVAAEPMVPDPDDDGVVRVDMEDFLNGRKTLPSMTKPAQPARKVQAVPKTVSAAKGGAKSGKRQAQPELAED